MTLKLKNKSPTMINDIKRVIFEKLFFEEGMF